MVAAPPAAAGIAGVKMKLTGTDDLGHAVSLTATTGPDGTYSFLALRPGTYTVIETQPTGYVDGKEKAGTSLGNSTATNDQISAIALTSGTSATGYLFGELATADVTVTQSPTKKSVSPGGTVTLTYVVHNTGTATATAVTVAINYGGLTFVSSASPDFSDTTKAWTVGTLAAGASETIQITFRASTKGTFTTTSQVSTTSPELSATNNSASTKVTAGTTTKPHPKPKPHPLSALWFLSSSTNARK